MMSSDGESLRAQFDALHAERVRTWEPDKLAKNVDQRRALVESYDPDRIARVGQRIEPFVLLDSDGGGEIALDDLVAGGPAVLIFFRFAGCPACNIALPHYDRRLRPVLDAAGIPLVAVSPQVPGPLGEIRTRHGLGYRVASDPGNRLGRRLGITFVPDGIPAGPPPAGWIGELTGTGTWELPQPTVLILGPGRIVRSIEVSPDWLARPEAGDIVAALGRSEGETGEGETGEIRAAA